uniref:Uncharacterized protein n=1 Tax=Triticum urartu TaxID=4572 RepID=A0A8R7PXX4_TRIUA
TVTVTAATPPSSRDELVVGGRGRRRQETPGRQRRRGRARLLERRPRRPIHGHRRHIAPRHPPAPRPPGGLWKVYAVSRRALPPLRPPPPSRTCVSRPGRPRCRRPSPTSRTSSTPRDPATGRRPRTGRPTPPCWATCSLSSSPAALRSPTSASRPAASTTLAPSSPSARSPASRTRPIPRTCHAWTAPTSTTTRRTSSSTRVRGRGRPVHHCRRHGPEGGGVGGDRTGERACHD